jgi:hypothetical protein
MSCENGRCARLLAACLWATIGLGVGCSDEPAADDAGATKTNSTLWLVQKDIDKKEWDAAVKADADLATIAGGVKLAFAAAGSIEDEEGATVLWAEFAKDADDERAAIVAVIRSCDKAGTCTSAKGTYSKLAATLSTADGNPLKQIAVGQPTLNKKLKTSNIDSGTVIATGLNRAAVVDPVLAKYFVDNGTWGTRRLVLLNRFGAQMGVDLAAIQSAAKATGLFDEVVHHQFVRRRDIDLLLPQLNALDVVVWVAAGVVKPYGNKPYRAVGMTVSRGIVGDELYHSGTLGKLLDAPPLGGPGLVILAGGNSLTSNTTSGDVLAKKLNIGPYRPVIGIEGQVTIAQAEAGVAELLKRLAAGDVLEVAMATAAAELGAATFQTAMIQEQREVWKIPVAPAKFWNKAPSEANLQLFVKVDPICADVSNLSGVCNISTLQNGTAIPAEKIKAIISTKFECKATFKGPYFSCEVDNPMINAKFWLKGLMTGREAGDKVLVYAQGQSDGKVKDFAVVGAGDIKKIDTGGGTTVISFDGPAAGSTFWNQDGQCCLAKTPLLIGHASSVMSKLELKP